MIKLKVRKVGLIGKTLGLIGKRNPEILLFKTRFGIHTFGLRFPIDVLILDDNGKIVQAKEGMGPNSIFFWNPKYKTVLELPVGDIKRKHFYINTKILLIIE